MSGANVEKVTPAPYSSERHADLVNHIASLKADKDEVSKRVLDLTDTDKPADAVAQSKMVQLSTRHGILDTEIQAAERELSYMLESKPKPKGWKRDETPLARFLRGGTKALNKTEKDYYTGMGGPSADMGKGVGIIEDNPGFLDVNFHKGMFVPNGRDIEVFYDAHEPFKDYVHNVRAGTTAQNVIRSDETPGGQDFTSRLYYDTLEFADRLNYIGGMFGAGTMIETDTGQAEEFPVVDDASEEGEFFTDQSSAATGQDIQGIREVDLETQVISSKFVELSIPFERDSRFDAESFVSTRLSRRVARGLNTAFTTGAGANKTPRGMITDAATGITTAAATTLAGAEIAKHISEVDIAYLMGEGSPYGLPAPAGTPLRGWMLNQKILAEIRALVGGNGQFLWRAGVPGLQMPDPDTIGGYPYRINNKMSDAVATGNNVMAFGNFGYYAHRMVRGRVYARFFDSGTASNFKARYILFEQWGGRFVGGFSSGNTCEAVKILKMR